MMVDSAQLRVSRLADPRLPRDDRHGAARTDRVGGSRIECPGAALPGLVPHDAARHRANQLRVGVDLRGAARRPVMYAPRTTCRCGPGSGVPRSPCGSSWPEVPARRRSGLDRRPTWARQPRTGPPSRAATNRRRGRIGRLERDDEQRAEADHQREKQSSRGIGFSLTSNAEIAGRLGSSAAEAQSLLVSGALQG